MTARVMDHDAARARRIDRLRLELIDERIWVEDDGERTDLLVAELDYARHPHAHENVASRYGAIVMTKEPQAEQIGDANLLDIAGAKLDIVRLLADGRSSFVVRTVGRPDRLVCFERTREYESSAVHLATGADALVVQRLARGWLRFTTPHSVATWDGIQWSMKVLSSRLAERVQLAIPDADPVLLANLLEVSAHWLGAGRIGATIVWNPTGDARDLGHIGLATAVDVPPLDMNIRSHFAAVLNALSQFDRAALVDATGCIATVGAHLWSSEASRREIPALRGTRHTSAVRFSADALGSVVFVVSSSGTLSVFHGGQRIDAG